jgi:hypothetical protein
MSRIVLDAEAGRVSAELARRGIPPHACVHVLVEVTLGGDLPMTAIARAGKDLHWLAEAPDLYCDADLIGPARRVADYPLTLGASGSRHAAMTTAGALNAPAYYKRLPPHGGATS